MKEIFFIKDTPANRISYYHILAFLVALPFDAFYSELILASLAIHTVIQLTRQRITSVRIPLMLPSILYLVTLLCSFYSRNMHQAFKDWEKQLALVLFPLIFAVTPLDYRKYRIPLLKTFAITCMLTIVYLFLDAVRVMSYNQLPLSTLFTTSFNNHNFSAPIGLHATYFSMYATLSFASFLYLLIVSKKSSSRLSYAAAMLILLAGILELSSRSGFIAALIIINLAPFFMFTKNTRFRFLLISVTASVAIVGFLVCMAPFKMRFISSLKQDLTTGETNQHYLVEPRMVRWECAWDLVKHAPVAGYGTGSETDLLKQKYYERQLYTSYLYELNAHNEYISFLIKSGLFGFCIYCFLLYAGFRTAIREKDLLFCSFLIIVAVVSFSENILDVNKGIFFFGFFFSFFIYASTEFSVPLPFRRGPRENRQTVQNAQAFNNH